MPTAQMNAASTPTQTSQDEARILALVDAVGQAHHNRDADGIAAPYAPHAVIYDLEPPLAHDGISIERKRNWLATWDSPVELVTRQFQVVVSGDHAYGHGYLRLSGVKKGVDHPISFWMRLAARGRVENDRLHHGASERALVGAAKVIGSCSSLPVLWSRETTSSPTWSFSIGTSP
jgi:ketosteroid isomerase-like protein